MSLPVLETLLRPFSCARKRAVFCCNIQQNFLLKKNFPFGALLYVSQFYPTNTLLLLSCNVEKGRKKSFTCFFPWCFGQRSKIFWNGGKSELPEKNWIFLDFQGLFLSVKTAHHSSWKKHLNIWGNLRDLSVFWRMFRHCTNSFLQNVTECGLSRRIMHRVASMRKLEVQIRKSSESELDCQLKSEYFHLLHCIPHQERIQIRRAQASALAQTPTIRLSSHFPESLPFWKSATERRRTNKTEKNRPCGSNGNKNSAAALSKPISRQIFQSQSQSSLGQCQLLPSLWVP